MQEKLTRRLEQLKTEFESGQKILAETEARQAKLRETLLRIGGAIQVLEEMLETQEQPDLNNIAVMGKTAS